MNEILVPLASGAIRFPLGLFEFSGFLLETDFRLAEGFFSAETFCALRSRVRRCKASRAKGQ